jgi:isoquinoline 1-oxidoreductase subunit beta
MMQVEISRRTFIRTSLAAGGGLLLGFHIPRALAADVESQPWTTPTNGVEINAWLTIDKDGVVTIRVPHTEMGQGALTSVAMMIAEELNVDWSKVQAVFADPNRHLRNNNEYKVMSTHGSMLVRLQHPHIMQAGASARERLKEAAARAWKVDRSTVEAKLGTLKAGKRTGSYAQFASAAALITLDAEPAIKKPNEWWLLGKSMQRLDLQPKVDGSAAFAIDTRLPGMVYAAVRCCPVPWGGLKSFNFDAIKGRPGVVAAIELKAVPGKTGLSDMQNGVAVVADSWYRAKTALDLMPVEWDFGPNAAASSASQLKEARQLLNKQGEVSNSTGADVFETIWNSNKDKVISAEYHRPYETHARMEPINATVSVADGRVDVWSPTQDQSVALRLAADQAGRDTKDVYVHTVFLGGGFGGGGGGNTAVTRQATEISRQLRRPVKVIWSREEDIAQDKQRPPSTTLFASVIGDKGLPSAWFSRSIWFTHNGAPTVGAARSDYAIGNMPYKVPKRHHERHTGTTHVPTATHRAPGANSHGFMTESFVDEVAHAGGWNPLDWRIEMTKGLPDWQLVLNTLKEKAGFRTDLPKGEGMGVAVVESHGTIAGACASVTVSRRGVLTIEKVVIVVDSGHVINPNNAAEQCEGSVCWELSHAWMGGLDLNEGRFTNTNFDSYNLLRIDQMPQVEVHFALSGGSKWGGLGEPAGPPAPPAVANAIFYATGKRIRTTPFRNHDLSWS